MENTFLCILILRCNMNLQTKSKLNIKKNKKIKIPIRYNQEDTENCMALAKETEGCPLG